MANKAFQRTYTQLDAITKATVSLKATGVANDELATVDGLMLHIRRAGIVSMSKVVVSLCIVLAASRAILALLIQIYNFIFDLL